VRKVWHWKIDEWINKGLLADVSDKYKNEIFLKKWPFVRPLEEANADTKRLLMGVDTRTAIAARAGRDIRDVLDEREHEGKLIKERNIVLDPKLEIKNKDKTNE